MKTNKKTSTASRFTRGQKVSAKKTRRHGRPRTEEMQSGENQSEEVRGRTLDRLTPA